VAADFGPSVPERPELSKLIRDSFKSIGVALHIVSTSLGLLGLSDPVPTRVGFFNGRCRSSWSGRHLARWHPLWQQVASWARHRADSC